MSAVTTILGSAYDYLSGVKLVLRHFEMNIALIRTVPTHYTATQKSSYRIDPLTLNGNGMIDSGAELFGHTLPISSR